MKLIPLTHGKFAKVCDCHWNYVSGLVWNAQKVPKSDIFYASKTIGKTPHRKVMLMHRLIMNVNDKNIHVDHKDNDGLNNQCNNLRISILNGNKQSRRKLIIKTSKYKGVSYYKINNKWVAELTCNGIRRFIGTFKNEADAAIAYNSAAIKYFGEFAKLNVI